MSGSSKALGKGFPPAAPAHPLPRLTHEAAFSRKHGLSVATFTGHDQAEKRVTWESRGQRRGSESWKGGSQGHMGGWGGHSDLGMKPGPLCFKSRVGLPFQGEDTLEAS